MKTMSDFDFDEILKEELAVVEFYSPQCAHCLNLAGALEEIESEFSDSVAFAGVDITVSPTTAAKFDVLSVPTLLFLKNGQMKEKFIGNTHEQIIVEQIKKLK